MHKMSLIELGESESDSQNYSLCHRTHQFSLPDHTGRLTDCNFLIRSLFKDVY